VYKGNLLRSYIYSTGWSKKRTPILFLVCPLFWTTLNTRWGRRAGVIHCGDVLQSVDEVRLFRGQNLLLSSKRRKLPVSTTPELIRLQ